uniref:Adhesion G protein-coupled receptor G1 n=1 Tax=Astyanax mexicanus TaxID=7994 RepID=A0A3B1JJZ5_ASTMX
YKKNPAAALLLYSVLENDKEFKFCGFWNHGDGLRNLVYDLKTGCNSIYISANESTLSLRGEITAQCVKSEVMPLSSSPSPSPGPSHFCVYWEPLLDRLMVKVGDREIPLCKSRGVQTTCCTNLSGGRQTPARDYGIINASVGGDPITSKVMAEYEFGGDSINCKEEFCEKVVQKARGANMIEDAVMRSNTVGNVDLPCAESSVIEMNEDFSGYNLTLTVRAKKDPTTVHLPACLKPPNKTKAKVVCTYYKNISMFQGSEKVLDEVIGISVENEIITNLPEPVRIKFHHSDILVSVCCVSWDTRKDNEITWREEGCVTVHINPKETECRCNHLTYFAILVCVFSVLCVCSVCKCVCVHVCVCFSVLCVCQCVCVFMGALLHYALLSTLCWMAVEVIQSFMMVCMVFKRLDPNPWIWYLLGFGFPVLPVVILASMGNIYGQRTVMSSDEAAKPFRMCWMTDSRPALLAHFILNLGFLAAVASSGCIMLLQVVRQVQNTKHKEWEQNRVKFLSIWGLSCLFGTTWTLAFGTTSETVVFFFCIINSLQGEFSNCIYIYIYIYMRSQKNPEQHLKNCRISLTSV